MATDSAGSHDTATSENQEYIDELNHLLTIAKHPKTCYLLQGAISAAESGGLGTVKVDSNGTESSKAKDLSVPSDSLPKEMTEPAMKPTKVSKERSISSSRIKEYGWDQSEKFVKIYITSLSGLEQLKQENVRPEFQERSMNVELVGVKGKNYSLVISDLFSPIIPTESTIKVRSGTVTISLRKSKKEEWQFLTQREKKLKDARGGTKPPKMDKEEDPSAGLMKLMKQMYDEGDDEMKRNITKAWHESQEKRAREGGL